MMWIELTSPEGIDQRLAVAPGVCGHQIVVSGDEGAQELAQLQINRRTVIDGADTDGQELVRQLAGLFSQDTLQLYGDFPGWQLASAMGGKTDVARCFAL